MKTKRIIRILTILSCIAAAILLIAALHLFRSNHNDSPGWRLLKTQDSYSLDSQQMNGTDSSTLCRYKIAMCRCKITVEAISNE